MVGNNNMQASAGLPDLNTMATETQGLKIEATGCAGTEASLWRSPAASENTVPAPSPQGATADQTQERSIFDTGCELYHQNSMTTTMHISEPSSFMLPASAMPMAFGPFDQRIYHHYPPPQDLPGMHFGYYDRPLASDLLAFLSNDAFHTDSSLSHLPPLPEQAWPRQHAYVDNRDRAIETLEEFEGYFGTMVSNIYAWQELCKLHGMPPSSTPSIVGQCKDYLKTVYVNIFDLFEARREERIAKPIFMNATELRLYSQETGKICPANVDGNRGKGMSSPLWRFCLKRWY